MEDARLTLLKIAARLDLEISLMEDEELQAQSLGFASEHSIDEKRQPGFLFRSWLPDWEPAEYQQALQDLALYKQDEERKDQVQRDQERNSPEWQQISKQLGLEDLYPDHWGTLVAIASGWDLATAGMSDEELLKEYAPEGSALTVADFRLPGRFLRLRYPHWTQEQAAYAIELVREFTEACARRRKSNPLFDDPDHD